MAPFHNDEALNILAFSVVSKWGLWTWKGKASCDTGSQASAYDCGTPAS